jgi:thiamine-monophosphate kinase
LGGSRTGWEALSADPGARDFPESIDHFLRPVPRLAEARLLLERVHPTSMIDISDGLSSEIIHLCRASGTGCVVREADLPIASEARRWAERQGLSLPDFVLNSGEEYELLFTVSSSTAFSNLPFVMTVIGEMTPPETGMRVVSKEGSSRPLTAKGWDHFTSP